MALLPHNFNSRHWLILAVMTLAGALVRVVYHIDRPFVGDEVGTLIYMEKDIPYLLTHFQTWLSMNYFIVTEKAIAALFGKGSFTLAALPLLAATATIPLTALLASRFTSPNAALVSSSLVAANPYLIEYSPIIRAYSLLVCMALLTLILFYHWRDKPSVKRGISLSTSVFFMVLLHPYGIYTVIFIFLMLLLHLIASRKKTGIMKEALSILIPVVPTAILILAAYWAIIPEMLIDGEKWHETPPTDISYIPLVFSKYFGKGFLGMASLLFFLVALIRTSLKDRAFFMLLLYIILPIVLMSLQGFSHFPQAYGRFLIFVLPIAILFIAEGIRVLAEMISPSKQIPVAIIGCLLVILTWVPSTSNLFVKKSNFPWNKIADSLKMQCKDQDLILCNNEIVCLNMHPYFPDQEYSKQALDKYIISNKLPSGSKVFFISSNCYLKTIHPQISMGKLQVVVYPANEGPVLSMLREDLVASVAAKQPDPRIKDYYKNIYLLNKTLSIKQDNEEYYSLWKKSIQLTNRYRYRPANYGEE